MSRSLGPLPQRLRRDLLHSARDLSQRRRLPYGAGPRNAEQSPFVQGPVDVHRLVLGSESVIGHRQDMTVGSRPFDEITHRRVHLVEERPRALANGTGLGTREVLAEWFDVLV